MVVTNWLMQCSLLRSCRSVPAVNLFEEGIFQALWSVGLEGRPGAVRYIGATLINMVSMPDVVVVVEADVEAVVTRLQKRQGNESRVDRWSRDDGKAFAHASSIMLEVIEALRGVDDRAERSRVIRVDNRSGVDPEVAGQQLAHQLETLWLSEARPAGIRAGQRTTA
jgi:hypothetical protein